MYKKIIAVICAVCLISCPVLAGTPEIIIDGQVVSERSIIDDACDWAFATCNDDEHVGYSWDDGWGGSGYHCVGFVINAYKAAGYNMGACPCVRLPEKLFNYGFVEVTDSVNLDTGEGLVKGDVLWMAHKGGKHGHTELYIGGGMLAGARGLGRNNDIIGDQDGSEVSVIPYKNLSWQRAFRPIFDTPVKGAPGTVSQPEIVIETVYEPEIVIETVSFGEPLNVFANYSDTELPVVPDSISDAVSDLMIHHYDF